MGSALLNIAELEFAATAGVLTALEPENKQQETRPANSAAADGLAANDLRRQVADRLAAHRRRRGGEKARTAEAERPATDVRSARIAAAVAERYARTPSYRQMLAAEAERAIQQARAAAEVAAQNAQAIAAAQQRMLEAYDEHSRGEQAERNGLVATRDGDGAHVYTTTQAFAESTAESVTRAESAQALWPGLREQATRRSEPARAGKRESRRSKGTAEASAGNAAALTVRLYQDAAHASLLSARLVARPERDSARQFSAEISEAEVMALDEEIAFRQAPVFEEPAGPPVALPANLIEFPRQLVAARKARPRHAEGPLRGEQETAPGDGQLRIFEVDPAQISTGAADAATETAQWTSLWLDGPARAAVATGIEALDEPLARALPALEPASLARRSAAGAINFAIALCGLAAFAGVFLAIAGHGTGFDSRSVATIGAVSGAALLAMYHALFLWFSTATPGMRCVRIALCTFEDENPTRAGVRRRMAAMMLSSCALGMGYAWAALDEQRLTWHDRMTGMYLRRY